MAYQMPPFGGWTPGGDAPPDRSRQQPPLASAASLAAAAAASAAGAPGIAAGLAAGMAARTGPYSGAAARNIPVFLNKLFNLVSDPANDEYIRWTDEGTSFVVPNPEGLSEVVLPQYFKHGNFTSFVRQLNMYRFHKVPHLQNGSLAAERRHELWEFSNPHFVRGRPDLLCFVLRKKGRDDEHGGAGGGAPDGAAAGVDSSRILSELATLRKHQMTISEDFKSLQRSHEALWRETAEIRELYKNQERHIYNIVQFLGSMVRRGNASKELVGQQPGKRPLLLLPDAGPSSGARIDTLASPGPSSARAAPDGGLSMLFDPPGDDAPMPSPKFAAFLSGAGGALAPAPLEEIDSIQPPPAHKRKLSDTQFGGPVAPASVGPLDLGDLDVLGDPSDAPDLPPPLPASALDVNGNEPEWSLFVADDPFRGS